MAIRSPHPANGGERAILPVSAGSTNPAVCRAGFARAGRPLAARAARPRAPARGAGCRFPSSPPGCRSGDPARSARRNGPGARPRRRGRSETRELAEGSRPARGTAAPAGGAVARRAGGPDRWPGPRPGRPRDRAGGPLAGSLEDPSGEPAVQRQSRHQGYEGVPRGALRGEVEDISLPALPSDQEVQRILVEIRERDLKDPGGVGGDLRLRHGGYRQQAESRENRTPHHSTMQAMHVPGWGHTPTPFKGRW